MNEILKMVLEKKNSQEYKDYLEKEKIKKCERLIDFVNRKKIIEVANDFFLKEVKLEYCLKIKPEEEKEFCEFIFDFSDEYVKEHYRILGYKLYVGYLLDTKGNFCNLHLNVKLIDFEEERKKKWWQIWK